MTLHRTPGTQSTCLSHTDSSAPENVLSEGLTSSWRPRFCLFVSLGALEVAEGKETALSSKAQGCSCHWYGGKATREISTNSEISARASSRLGRALLAMASQCLLFPRKYDAPGSHYQEVVVGIAPLEAVLGAGFQLFPAHVVQESAVGQSSPPLSSLLTGDRSLQTPLVGVRISSL